MSRELLNTGEKPQVKEDYMLKKERYSSPAALYLPTTTPERGESRLSQSRPFKVERRPVIFPKGRLLKKKRVDAGGASSTSSEEGRER